MVETIEGEVIESAVAVIEPREMLAETITPEGTVSLATRMATALKDIVEKQHLYAVIGGKKFPQVEAWMTIARMDNVVAREVIGGILRFEDGSYEATVELIRLSDGMVIGRGSALCGSKGDRPWDSRPEPARRSMAVTRATSRAFRQQYSWIMALAGYEPTPADEMPQEGRSDDQRPVGQYQTAPDRPQLERTTHENGLVGKAVTSGSHDFELRETPDGYALPFRVKEGNRTGQIVIAEGDLATALYPFRDTVLGQTVTVWGHYTDESFDKDGKTIGFKVLHLERIATPDFILPATTDAPPVDPHEAEIMALDF